MPITDLLRNSDAYEWSHDCTTAFQNSKDQFTKAPILQHFEPMRQIVVESNVSSFTIGTILSQVIDWPLHPIAFYSRKMDKSEINYDIHGKELLAMVAALKEWRCYLKGVHHQFQLYTGNNNLDHFTTTKIFNGQQARSAQEVAGYDFRQLYHPGSANGKPDAWSWRLEYRPKTGEGSIEEIENQPIQQVPRPDQLLSVGGDFIWTAAARAKRSTIMVLFHQLQSKPIILSSQTFTAITVLKFDKHIYQNVILSAQEDEDWLEAYDRVLQGKANADVTLEDKPHCYEGTQWVPNNVDLRKMILHEEHNSIVACHIGQ